MDPQSNRFDVIDFVVFGAMLFISLFIGIYFGCCGKVKTVADYLMGNREMKTIPIAISLVASQLSGVLIISVPGEIYLYGSQYFMIVLCMILVVLILNHVILPVFFENQITNCYEYLELRFSKSLRRLQTFFFVITVLLLLPVILFVPALTFARVTGFNIHLINALVTGLCVFYTMLGGVRGVVYTDVFQGFIMLVSCLVIITVGVNAIGSLMYVIHLGIEGDRFEFFNTNFDLETRHTIWNILIGYTIMWASYVGLNQSCIQRIMALPSLAHAKRALHTFALGYLIIVAINCFTGIVIYAQYRGCDPLLAQRISKPDELVPLFVSEVIGRYRGLTGLFVSSVFSAGLSTMSANLNALAGVFYEDHIRQMVKHSEVKANVIMKLIIVSVGTYSVLMGLFMEQFGSILQLVLLVLSVNNGATFGVFTLGLLWPRANTAGAFAGVILSTVSVGALMVVSQLKRLTGEIVNPTLANTIDKCDNYEALLNSTMTEELDENVPVTGSIFNIAIPWLAVLSCVIVWVVGIIVSLLTGGHDLNRTGSKLISPCCKRFVPLEIRELELRDLDTNHNQRKEHVWVVDRK